MQVRLLRVLETGRFTRVGGEDELQADVRVRGRDQPRSAAQAVRDGQLREDLMYRLAVFPIALPPLREREGDAELLAEHFLQELNAGRGHGQALLARRRIATIRAIAGRATCASSRMPCSARSSWPTTTSSSTSRDWPAPTPVGQLPAASPSGRRSPKSSARRSTRRSTIATATSAAAREMLGISLKTLYNRLTEYQSRRRRRRDAVI